MSQVRMCDRCGTIFSERDEGWESYTATRRVKNENGQWIEERDALDSCVSCTARGIVRPTVKSITDK